MRISGTIDFIELEELKILLKNMFTGDQVVHKIRVLGDEFKIINKIHELYVSTFDPTNQNPMKKPRFSFEGDIKMNLAESIVELRRITKALNNNKLIYCIAYYPNENDDTQEIEVMSENYWETYEQMRIK